MVTQTIPEKRSNAAQQLVEGPEELEKPLNVTPVTAEFKNMPIEHDGINPFSDDRTIRSPLSAQVPGPAKRQLFDFKPMPTPWLEKYPIIQQEVKKIIKHKKESIAKEAEELLQEFPNTALLPFELQVKELKLFEHDKQDIVSVRMAMRIYTGGAHGNYFYYSWNWDKQRNKFVSLNELITPKQFQALIKYVRYVIFERRKQNDKYDEKLLKEIERGTSKEEDFKVWNFKKDGIEVTFPEYQVASFAEGHFEVFVSLDSL